LLDILSFLSFMVMLIFLFILIIGFVYEWVKGALDWE
jgi:NADH-quinone oxidoreductase subunit A